jgi:hypothetical protein
MAWLEKLQVFRERFTPRRRRIVGGALLAAWVAGVVVCPGQYLLGLSIPGVIIFFSGWPAQPDRNV